MEDKWFIFYEEPWLYLHRSWTGAGIYGVRFQSDGAIVPAVESWASRDASYKATSVEYDRAILRFLIEGLLVRTPDPIPRTGRSTAGCSTRTFSAQRYRAGIPGDEVRAWRRQGDLSRC